MTAAAMIRSVCVSATLLAVLLSSPLAHAATDQPETKEQRDARMKWWREARFGMFIHWGLYSVPAGTYKGEKIQHIGEWIMNDAKIPVAEYADYAKQFDPEKFNADEWVATAKNAGMKYIVITSKHHDGFAMFHSSDPYNIYDATPFHRDPLKELAEACKKQGMKLGFYYSQAQDWHHAGGAAMKRPPADKIIDEQNHWDKAQQGSFDDYLDKVALPQVKEILSNYGPVAVLWWDTPAEMNKERAEKFLPILKLQPDIITNNRLVHDVPEIEGDTETPEQYIPATGFPGRDWETCMTMNDTWGYKSWDNNWKSSETLLHNLIDIASKGGNYLLNVGPTSEGLMPQASLERLKAIGDWMKINGDAIYASSPSPFRKYQFDGRATTKGNSIYLIAFKWPADGIKVSGIKTPLKAAKYLDGGGGATVKNETDANGSTVLTIAPPTKIDPIATAVELQFDSKPEVDLTATAVHAADDKSITLSAADASVNGRKAKLDGDHIGSWSDRRDAVLWDFLPKQAGTYKVAATYACAENTAGAEFTLSVGDAKLTGKVESTGGEGQYKTVDLGTITVGDGLQTLMIRPTKLDAGNLIELKTITLTPAN